MGLASGNQDKAQSAKYNTEINQKNLLCLYFIHITQGLMCTKMKNWPSSFNQPMFLWMFFFFDFGFKLQESASTCL